MVQSICKAAELRAGELKIAKRTEIVCQLKERYDIFKANKVADEHQPAQLIEAQRFDSEPLEGNRLTRQRLEFRHFCHSNHRRKPNCAAVRSCERNVSSLQK